jgi:hypothetical protein
MLLRTIAFCLALGAVMPVPGSADTLLLDQVRQSAADTSQRPARGMSMAKVEAAYGTPTVRRDPVGDPPITRWEYDDFIVYFEYQTVIHSVRKGAGSR